MAKSSPPKTRIVVATHHKAGTIYCLRVFGEICSELGWNFWDMETNEKPDPWHIAFHGNATPERLKPALREGGKLLHVVRHPKSLIVSGARYHLDAEEAWLDEPNRGHGGRSYRQALTDLQSQRERISFEMNNKGKETITEMVELESSVQRIPCKKVKLEDLSRDSSRRTYADLLAFLGFEGEDLVRSGELCAKHALWSMENLPSHARGGVTADWSLEFSEDLHGEFARLFGEAEVVLGYRRRVFPTVGTHAPSPRSPRPVDKAAIWLRVPKCAGASIERAFEDHGLLSSERPAVGKVYQVPGGDFIGDRERFTADWDRAFKFAVVRNPWDRLVSGWRYVAADVSLRDLLLQLPEKSDFHRWHHVTRLQSEFLLDENGELIPDMLLRFERLREEFARCCERMGMPRVILPRENWTARSKDYRSYYDEETRELVAELFRTDIDLFGYEF